MADVSAALPSESALRKERQARWDSDVSQGSSHEDKVTWLPSPEYEKQRLGGRGGGGGGWRAGLLVRLPPLFVVNKFDEGESRRFLLPLVGAKNIGSCHCVASSGGC